MQVITTLLVISAAAVFMQAFGILRDTKIKVDSMLKEHEFLPPEYCDLKGFIILERIFKPVSQDSWFEEGS